MNTFDLSLDLDKRAVVTQWVTLRQGDHDGTQLRATIYDHGTQVSDSYTCRVSIRKPTDNEYYRETCSFSGGVAIVTIDEQYAASEVGITYGYFELLQGTAVIASTENFGVRILPSAIDGAIVAPPYDSAIEDALAELDEATGRISQMVQDATAEYLEAHPEITTTVQDNSVTDAKLIQKGGILSREQWLETMLPNIPRKTTAEADVHSVTDSAGGGPLGIEVYGRSTQDGTPTPDAPVPIKSVTGNLYRETVYAIGQTWTSTVSVTKADYSRYIVNGTSTGTHWLYGGGNNADDRLFVTLPAGTYTAVLGGADASKFLIATRGKINGSVTALSTSGNPNTFTIDSEIPVEVAIFTLANRTFANSEVSIQLFEGSSEGGAFVPYGNIGLAARRTSDTSRSVTIPIDLGGRSLRSLPDGTRDEVNVDEWGHAILTQRVLASPLSNSNYIGATILSSGLCKITQDMRPLWGTLARPTNALMSDVFKVVEGTVYAENMAVTIEFGGGITRYLTLYFDPSTTGVNSVATYKTWAAEHPYVLQSSLAEPVTIDLGYLDPALLPAPDLTAYVVPSAPSVLRYGFDVAAAIAEIATS